MTGSVLDQSAREAARKQVQEHIRYQGVILWPQEMLLITLDELDRRDAIESEQAKRIAELEAENAELLEALEELRASNSNLRKAVAERDEALEFAFLVKCDRLWRSANGDYHVETLDTILFHGPTPLAAIQDAMAKSKGGGA